uniref:Uncharacterized protein n=1 Tax=Arundo donax TaxID=35708 RepID=A0A0A9AL91_ARUDO
MTPAPCWCPDGLNRTQKRRVQHFRSLEKVEKEKEEERDRWLNQVQPMVIRKKTWREKQLAREETGDSADNDSSSSSSDQNDDHTDVNMVFELPAEF